MDRKELKTKREGKSGFYKVGRSTTSGLLNSGVYCLEKDDFGWAGMNPGVGKDRSRAVCATGQ